MGVSRICCGRYMKLRVLLLVTIALILLNIVKYLQNRYEKWPNRQQMTNFEFHTSDTPFKPDSWEVIDWHDHGHINHDLQRTGMGEQGRPAKTDIDPVIYKTLYSENGFNAALSDRILLNRSLPDIRHVGCKKKMYLRSLPTVGVVVPFHNEHWSTLLRTVQSVVDRSPAHLLKEVFIVDDASSKEFLKDELDRYISHHHPLVSVVRQRRRGGLIAARLAGAQRVTADVIVFLDSHTEVNVNWLPPLIEPIAKNYKTAVCPLVDIIDYETFEIRPQDEGARGAFDWEFFYKRLPLLPNDIKNMPEPFASPVMAGGLFAISRHFFYELGAYDPQLDIWGGEQYELSFKIWQCGGRLLDAPCSRVGHVYRKFAPFPDPRHGDFVGKNYRRVAEVWMDEYAEHLYRRRPHYRAIDPGDLTAQWDVRTRLKCKSFKWFMTQVAFDLEYSYPAVEPANFAEGRIMPSSSETLCASGTEPNGGAGPELVYLTSCSKDTSQKFRYTWRNEIKVVSTNMCWDLPDVTPFSPITLYACHRGAGNQLWNYDVKTKKIIHGVGDKCVEWNNSTRALYINVCNSDGLQQWSFEHVDMAAIEERAKIPRVRPTAPVEHVDE